MTMPAQIRNVQLPEPQPPTLTRMVTQSLFPSDDGRELPVVWAISKEHPLEPQMRVIRMFIADGVVEIYSIPMNSTPGAAYKRNTIPMSRVRFTEEVMPLDVFVDELLNAEAGYPDDDDPDDDPEIPEQQATTESNGQSV